MQNARQVSTNDDDYCNDYDEFDDYSDVDYGDDGGYFRCAWILIERPGSWRGSVLDLPKSRRPFVVTN